MASGLPPLLVLGALALRSQGLHSAGHARAGCRPVNNSLCRPSPRSLPLLVTGIGSSGTHTIQRIFAMNKVLLGHESVGQHGSVSWPYAVDVTRATSPIECFPPPHHTFNHVVHVVRCPRDVVSAMHNGLWQSAALCALRYVRDTLKLEFGTGRLDSLQFDMLAWLKWNEHVESYAEARYRIDEFEDGDTLRSIAAKAGLGDIGTPVVPAGHENHQFHGTLTWSQLRAADGALAEQLQRKARDYGFPSSCFEDNATAREAFRPLQDGPDVVLTTDEDSITWVWNRTTVAEHARAFGEAFRGTAAAERLRGH